MDTVTFIICSVVKVYDLLSSKILYLVQLKHLSCVLKKVIYIMHICNTKI
jgi:hypothetical protein